jgi:hypothetical protein
MSARPILATPGAAAVTESPDQQHPSQIPMKSDLSCTSVRVVCWFRARVNYGPKSATNLASGAIQAIPLRRGSLGICHDQESRSLGQWHERRDQVYEMLDDRGIDYEAEAITQNGDSFVLIDALVKKPKVVAFELDGSVHDRQKRYDMQRDRWLLRSRKIPTVRFRNQDVYKRIAWVRQRVLESLGEGIGDV